MRRGRIALLAWLAAVGAAAGGCAVADTGAFVRVQDDMESLKREVAALKADRGAAFPQPGAGDVSPLRRNLADLASENDRIKADLLALSARTDDAKVQMQREVTRLNDVTAELGQAVTELRRKNTEAERRVAALEEKLGRAPAERTDPGTPPEASVRDLSTPEEMYDYALGLVKRGENRKGREVLNAFAGKYPDHRLMQNVYYWKGESFYADKDYESAILSFQDVVDRYPAGDKAPDAMLKQGLSFQALNDPKNARILYELVRSKYPRSAAAEKARERLLQLK